MLIEFEWLDGFLHVIHNIEKRKFLAFQLNNTSKFSKTLLLDLGTIRHTSQAGLILNCASACGTGIHS